MTRNEFRKKLDNYWYYYKVHTIVAVFVVVLAIFFIKQCTEKVDPDITVLIVTKNTAVSEQQVAEFQKILSGYTGDLNGDGRKVAECEQIYISPKENADARAAMTAKLYAEISSGDSMLFITDDGAFSQLCKIKLPQKISGAIQGGPQSDEISIRQIPAFKKLSIEKGMDSLSVILRKYKGTDIDKPQNDAAYKNSVNTLTKLIKN